MRNKTQSRPHTPLESATLQSILQYPSKPLQTVHVRVHNTNNSFSKQVQTPQQRRANEAFAKSEAAKRGKPQTEVERLAEKKKAAKLQAQKSPVSKVWLCKFFDFLSFCWWECGVRKRRTGGISRKRESEGQEDRERRKGEEALRIWIYDVSARREEKKRRRLDREKRSNKKGRNI
jgi:hypothetical protein